MGRTKRIYFNTEETITTKKKGWIEIDLDFTQIYDSFSTIAAGIKSATSFKLLFWLLANKMNDENGVDCSKRSYEEFNAHLKDHCNQDCGISYSGYIKCMHELNQVGALTKVQKGHYYANPHLFWGGDKDDRLSFLELEAKDPELRSLNPIIHDQEDGEQPV
jgi:hypothetical protein